MLDLIQALTSEISTDAGEARLIAGRMLAYIEEQLRRQYGPSTAEELASHLPHWRSWRAATLTPVREEPDEDERLIGVDATLLEVLGHVGLDPLKAGTAVPVVSAFLRQVLPYELLRRVLQVAPFLAMAAPERSPSELCVKPGGMYGE